VGAPSDAAFLLLAALQSPKQDGKRHGIKFLIDFIDLWPKRFQLVRPRMLQPIGRFILEPFYARFARLIRESDGLVAVTGNYREAFLRGTEGVPSAVSYCGVETRKDDATDDLARWPEGWSPSPDDLTVIYGGALEEAYDLPCVIQAIELPLESDERARFIFAGGGPFKYDISALAEKAPDREAFIESVPASELQGWYARSIGLRGYASGSAVSMPITVFNHFATGLAIVGSVGGEARQLITSGCGPLYQAGNPERLAAVIGQFSRPRASLEAAKALSKSLSEDFDSRIQYDLFFEFAENVERTR
jgi:glycosyltransferase involved in cell wall biosynthesis